MLKNDMTIMIEALGGSAEAFEDLEVTDTYTP